MKERKEKLLHLSQNILRGMSVREDEIGAIHFGINHFIPSLQWLYITSIKEDSLVMKLLNENFIKRGRLISHKGKKNV